MNFKSKNTAKREIIKISINWKLGIFGFIIIALFAVILYVMVIPLLRHEKLIEREGKLKAVVDSVVSLMQYYENAIRTRAYINDPSLPTTVEQAKTLILRNVRKMRYDVTEYIFILDGNGVMIMHPVKKELEGESMLSVKDHHGAFPFKDMALISQLKGETFIQYTWLSKWSKTVYEPQTTYAKYFYPWDWVICSSVYTQDIKDSIKKVTIVTSFYFIIITFCYLIILWDCPIFS